MKPRKRLRRNNTSFLARRVLSETSKRVSKSTSTYLTMKLSDALETLPMTIDHDDIYVSAELTGGKLILTAYCNEMVSPLSGPEGGEYIIEETDQDDNNE